MKTQQDELLLEFVKKAADYTLYPMGGDGEDAMLTANHLIREARLLLGLPEKHPDGSEDEGEAYQD